MSNHLIIGLGGTGGRIIRALRKTIYQEFRQRDPIGVNIGYIYVDSSAEMMSLDDQNWKILGASVQLGNSSQVLISGADLHSRLEQIDSYPGLRDWIGDRTVWSDVLNEIIGDNVGGQRRRLGRFLFASNIEKFNTAFRTATAELKKASSEADITFHICCGLAGGTGSGTLIDTLAQIRKDYPPSDNTPKYRIILYLFLPEQHPKPNWNLGNYHANGYAALKELNALGVSRFKPCDVAAKVPARLSPATPFNGCYVYTNQNENGVVVDVEDDLPGIVADFLFQKIVAANSINWGDLARQENSENGDGTPEMSPDKTMPERAKRFLTFGIKRLAIPEAEIREYLMYNFARQTALQLRYNHWSDELGFIDTPKNEDFHSFVRDKKNLERWLLTDEHLCLSLGILQSDIANKKWKPIHQYWEIIKPPTKNLALEKDSVLWLSELASVYEQHFAELYRGSGVKSFYGVKLQARKDIAKEIRKGIEQEWFDAWRNGNRSLFDIKRMLEALLKFTEERLHSVEEKIIRQRQLEEREAAAKQENERTYANVGWLAALFGKRKKLFNAQAEVLQKLYTYRNRLEAWAFAKFLLSDVVTELTDLMAEVDTAIGVVSEASETFHNSIAQRCNDTGESDLKSQLIRFYDPSQVHRITRSLIADETLQKQQTGKVRAGLAAILGTDFSFKRFNERLRSATFVNMLEQVCLENAQTAHQQLEKKDHIIGVSIIEELKDRYGNDPQGLRKYVQDLVNHAGNYISFDPLEVQRCDPGIPSATTKITQFTVILPEAPEHRDFVKQLETAFTDSKPPDISKLEFIRHTNQAKSNEIVLVSTTNLFPLRFLAPISFLKQEYEKRINGGDADKAKLVLHIEGDGRQHPPLYVTPKKKEDYAATMLLANAMKMFSQSENPLTGETQLALLEKDESGLDLDPIYLGQKFSDAIYSLDIEKLDDIAKRVEKQLEAQFLHVTKREQLKQLIVQEVEAIKKERNDNITDPQFKIYRDGAREAIGRLHIENVPGHP